MELVCVVSERKYGYGRTVHLADGRSGKVISRYKHFGKWRYTVHVPHVSN